ncbi:MAG: (2Fe-2S) ferredoxin domain-containing protein [Acutalibacteraceae bacterium]|nr:(2Fe-2S) ferredoxin domain-containing protein [Acutalibacteraceae bacterium]
MRTKRGESMKVYVCVGSSCHLRGSYDIIQLMKDRLKKNGLEDNVELSAAFCLGKCTQGVSVKVDDEIICGVSKENFDEVFNQYILKK